MPASKPQAVRRTHDVASPAVLCTQPRSRLASKKGTDHPTRQGIRRTERGRTGLPPLTRSRCTPVFLAPDNKRFPASSRGSAVLPGCAGDAWGRRGQPDRQRATTGAMMHSRRRYSIPTAGSPGDQR